MTLKVNREKVFPFRIERKIMIRIKIILIIRKIRIYLSVKR
nr:MAG TPA: hypothetical protein [Caudoviricetes sp.]